MVSQYMKDNYYNPPNGKPLYRYVMSDGVPRAFTMPMSKHALAVVAGQSDTKFLRECAEQRFPQTTYGPVPDGIYSKTVKGKRHDRTEWYFILGGSRSQNTFSSFGTAEQAFTEAQKAAA